MLGDDHQRKTILIVCIFVIVIFFIWYGSIEPDPDSGRFPGEEEILQDYDDHLFKEVEIGGRVTESKSEDDTFTIEIEHADEEMDLLIFNAEKEVNRGDHITVYGTLEENKTLRAENAIVRSNWRYIYMYGISGVAAIWVGGRLMKEWRWESSSFGFKKRDEELKFTDLWKQKKGERKNDG